MKHNKKFIAIGSMALCAALSFGLAGCGEEPHEHAYEWEVTTPATCTRPGEETGTCPTDDQKTIRPVAIDPDAHTYGEWEITEPTFEEEGEAVKSCTANAEHTPLKVTLPVLGSSDYTVQVTTQPQLAVEGEATYTLANANGNITFTAPVAALSYANVGEAILAAHTQKDLVGKTEELRTVQEYEEGEYVEKKVWTTVYALGDKYIYVDYDGTDLHLSLDAEGNIEHYVTSSTNEEGTTYAIPYGEPEAFAPYVDGYHFIFSGTLPAGEAYSAYGTENMLKLLYEYVTEEAEDALVNGGYSESFSIADGKATGTMSFNRYEKEERGLWDETGYYITENYYVTEVAFTLDANSMLESLNIATTQYTYEYSTKPDKTTPYEDGDVIDSPFSADASGVYSMDASKLGEDYEPNEYSYAYRQTALSAIETKPVYPVDMDKAIVSSFELKNGEEKVDASTTLTATTAETINLDIDGIAPETAKDYLGLNSVSVYLKEGDTLTELGYYSEIIGYYSQWSNQVTVRSLHKVENATIVVKFGDAETSFKLTVSESAPTGFTTNVTVYSEATDTWAPKLDSKATIYVGQKLTLTAEGTRPSWEEYDVDGNFTATASTGATLTDGENGAMVFSATAAGTYTVTLTSTVDSSVSTPITVTVKEIPDLAANVLVGNYENKKSEATVAFGADNKVTVSYAEKTETLVWSLSENKLTTSHDSGVEAGYGLVLNDNYNLVLTYKDAGNATQRILLTKEGEGFDAEAALAGTTWTDKMGQGYKLTFNADGTAQGIEPSMWGSETKVNLTYTIEAEDDTKYSLSFKEVSVDPLDGFAQFFYEDYLAGSYFTVEGGAITGLFIGEYEIGFKMISGGSNTPEEPTDDLVLTGTASIGGTPTTFTLTLKDDGTATLLESQDAGFATYDYHYDLTYTVDGTAITFTLVASPDSDGMEYFNITVANDGSTVTLDGDEITGVALHVVFEESEFDRNITLGSASDDPSDEVVPLVGGADFDGTYALFELTLNADGTATLVETQDGNYVYNYSLYYSVVGDAITFLLTAAPDSDGYEIFNVGSANMGSTVTMDGTEITSVSLHLVYTYNDAENTITLTAHGGRN